MQICFQYSAAVLENLFSAIFWFCCENEKMFPMKYKTLCRCSGWKEFSVSVRSLISVTLISREITIFKTSSDSLVSKISDKIRIIDHDKRFKDD